MFADEGKNGIATQSSSDKTNFFVPTSTEIYVSHVLRYVYDMSLHFP